MTAQDNTGPTVDRSSGMNGRNNWAELVAFWVLASTLAWAPFPLGSNRPWSWSLLVFLMIACWALWLISVWSKPERPILLARQLAVPLVLAALAIMWGLIQTVPWVPKSWIHPVWSLAADALGRNTNAAISLDPWRTVTEVMKLTTYGVAAWLACCMTLRVERARRLLDILIIVGTFYALYALALGLTGNIQFELFYSGPPVGDPIAGPFVLHNSFATYAGLTTLCACVRLFSLGNRTVIVGRGSRQFILSVLRLLFGSGALAAFAILVSFSMLVASASRAGFLATLVGMVVLLMLSGTIARRRSTIAWSSVGIIAIVTYGLVLFAISGKTLEARFGTLIEAGGTDQIRLALWAAASRMIADTPWLGLGVGTFENAYPLYADHVLPYAMDKAHNDYLELAAGWGLPAACAWWAALLWLIGICVKGIFIRRRNRIYSLLAVGATALVGFHSAFDFSLQIPAVALTYAVILGLGIAQSFPTRITQADGV